MNRLRLVVLPLLATSTFLVGQPTPASLNPNAAIATPDAEQAQSARPESGIDWSLAEPSFPDLTGIYPLPVDTADPWLEPEKITDCSKVACIALTFDDGPLPGYTDGILEILDQLDAMATFFVVGRMVNNYPDLLLAIMEQGHELAGHSYSHSRLTELGSESLARDFAKTNSALRDLTGREPAYYRPPYGMHNQRVRAAAEAPTIMWSIDPQDWRRTTTAAQMVRYVLDRAHPGAIVLFHDQMTKTAKALPEIIEGLRGEGYELVTVAEILGPNLDSNAVYRSGLTPPATDPAAD